MFNEKSAMDTYTKQNLKDLLTSINELPKGMW